MNLPSSLSSSSFHDHGNHSLYWKTSKSRGSILHALQRPKSSDNVIDFTQQSNCNTNIAQGSRVCFQLNPQDTVEDESCSSASSLEMDNLVSNFAVKLPPNTCTVIEMTITLPEIQAVPEENLATGVTSTHLGRPRPNGDKSTGAAEIAAAKGSAPGFEIAKETLDLGSFPLKVAATIQKAVKDPNDVSTRALVELVRIIVDRVFCGISYALPAAKLCITIIKREKKETFLESLLNTCKQCYQQKDSVLGSAGPPGTTNTHYHAFMHFLNEMYCELKCRQFQLKTQHGLVLLNLLYKGCQDCVKPPITKGDADSLLFVLTTAGHDLEQELPQKLQQLFANIRDTFLTVTATSMIKKKFLQLIELYASHWRLSYLAVKYYSSSEYKRPPPS